MKALVVRVCDALRARLGLDPVDHRLRDARGWLLPLVPAVELSPAVATWGARR